jgi:radical SAM protein with 4Fe4S-binding SPASM domain
VTVQTPSLTYVVWELTLRCDLACAHCGSRAGKARTDELSTAEALDVVTQLADLGAREVSLIGGEAYLREDWDQIARAIVDAGMTCSVVTGGRGMTPERAARAAAAGVSGVSVSLDGLEAAHDEQRGVRGAFAAALRAMDALRTAGVAVAANTQVNRRSLADLDGVLDLLIEREVYGWQVQLTVPMGRAAERPEWILEPYHLLEVIPAIAQLKQRAARHGVRLDPGNNVGYFGPHEEILRGALGEGQVDAAGRHTTGCTAGLYTLGLEADGSIKGCPSLPTSAYRGGSVRERSLREVWDSASELAFNRDPSPDALWGYCASCYYAEECRAGCTWTSHVILGRPGNNPFCHHRALEHDRQGLRERLVQVARAPGLPFDHGRFELVLEPRPPTTHPLPGGLHEPGPLPHLPPPPAPRRRHLPVL